ncbi:hypothetical protein ACQ4PT_067426 [Festuca glaucescens]
MILVCICVDVSAAPERRGGPRLLQRSTGRPSRAVTSPPPRGVTSPSRTHVPPRRRLLPLHTCQRRILSVPGLEVEQASSPPPLSGQAPLPRRGRSSLPLHARDLRAVRLTIQGYKPFDWVEELRSWSDDGLD